jgi:pimeloyl-ACP methyl ester carboxylesterase
MDVPDARYARSGGVAIAYQVVGEGPPDVVFSPHLADIYSLWLIEHHRAFLDRLAKEARLIVFNPRGTGLSDRPRNVTLESRMDDFSAVLDDVGSDRVTISGIGQSANACALFAATYPDRCDRLAVANLSPRGLRCESYPYGLTEDEMLENIRITRDRWGERSYAADYARFHDPWQDDTVIDQLVWQSQSHCRCGLPAHVDGDGPHRCAPFDSRPDTGAQRAGLSRREQVRE